MEAATEAEEAEGEGLMMSQREPLAIRALIVAVVNALIVFGVVHLTDVQVDGIFAAVDGVLAMLAAVLWARPAVTPVADPNIPGSVVVPEGDDY